MPPLARSRARRVLAGVCRGLAERTGVDPIIYRVVAAVLGIVGIGLLLYVAGWLLLPPDPGGRSPVERVVRVRVDGTAVLALVVAGLVACDVLFAMTVPGFGSMIVVLGVAALVAHRRGVSLGGALGAVPRRLRSPPRPAPGGEKAHSDFEYPGDGAAFAPAGSAAPSGPEPRGDGPEDSGAPYPPPGRYGEHGPLGAGCTPVTAPEPPVAPADDPYTLPHGSDPAWGADHDQSPPFSPAARESSGIDMSAPMGPPPGYSPNHPPVDTGSATAPVTWPYDYGDMPGSPAADPWGAPPPRPRGGARLTVLTVLAALLTAGTLTGLALSGAVPLSPQLVVASGTVVIGLGLLAGTWWGRGRPLVIAGLIAALFLAATNLLAPLMSEGSWLRHGVGDRTWRPTGSASAHQKYDLSAGEGLLDLRRLPDSGNYRYTAEVGMGELRVRAPADVRLVVHAEAGLGSIVVDGREVAHGSDSAATATLAAEGPGPHATVRLDLDVGMGEVRVVHGSP